MYNVNGEDMQLIYGGIEFLFQNDEKSIHNNGNNFLNLGI